MRRGTTPSRSQVRQDSGGMPQATAASLTFPHAMRCRTSASRAPKVESSGIQPFAVDCSGACVMTLKIHDFT
jgi:hypothetical protein